MFRHYRQTTAAAVIDSSAAAATSSLPVSSPPVTKKVALWKQPHSNRRILARTAASASASNSNNQTMVYNCDVCGKAFGYLFSMKKHREKHAPFIAGGTFQPSFVGEEHHLCVQCNRMFSCYASLKRHQLTTHTENGPVFHCPYCPYSNPFSWQVKRHIYKRHGHEESFFCGGCKNFFRTDVERDRHVCSAQSDRLNKQQSQSQHNQQEEITADDGQQHQSSPFYDDGRDDNEMTVDKAGGDDPDGDHEQEQDDEDELISVDDDDDALVNVCSSGVANTCGNEGTAGAVTASSVVNGAHPNAAPNGSQSDTPCICSECGQCLPCFEAMVKHQTISHPHRSGHDDGPTPLISSSRLNRQHPFISSTNSGGGAASPCFQSAAVRTNGFQQDNSHFIHRHQNSQSSLSLLASAAATNSTATTNNLLMVNHHETSVASRHSSPSSTAAVVESSSSSPSFTQQGSINNQHPFECAFCGILFSDPALWGLHTTMHDVNDLRKCNFCGRQAKDKYDFWRHYIDHNKVPAASSLATPPASSNLSVNTTASTSSTASVAVGDIETAK